MSLFKKVIATLTAWRAGRENMPDRMPEISEAQRELRQEQNLAREREAMQRERMRRQQEETRMHEGVHEETVEIPEDDKAA